MTVERTKLKLRPLVEKGDDLRFIGREFFDQFCVKPSKARGSDNHDILDGLGQNIGFALVSMPASDASNASAPYQPGSQNKEMNERNGTRGLLHAREGEQECSGYCH
jgi:hypothetical protein